MKKLSNPHGFPPAEFLSEAAYKNKSLYRNVKMALARGFIVTLFVFAISILFPGCKKESQEDQKPVLEQELDQLRNAVSSYGDIQKAIADGYDTDVTGYRTQMGFHYLNASLVDNKFEIKKPEILVYAPYGKDSLKFVAVEYATPITDINNPPPVPEGFTGSGDAWEINTEFKLWTLHVWVGLDNAHGIFHPHNPKLP